MLWLCTVAVACAGDAGETIAATVREFVKVTSMGIDGVNKQINILPPKSKSGCKLL